MRFRVLIKPTPSQKAYYHIFGGAVRAEHRPDDPL